MTNSRIKICGIKHLEDAQHAEAAGVDALGFVFVPRSKRFVSIAQAADISARLGPFLTRVGLFLDSDPAEVTAALAAIPELHLQFHGAETPEYCDSFARPYIKAIGLGSGMPDEKQLNQYQKASAFLFDSNATGELGGTGHTFDWRLLQSYAGKPLILAGGLTADNVAEGIQLVRPYAVDVSTGLERSPGLKNPQLVSQFVSAAHGIDW